MGRLSVDSPSGTSAGGTSLASAVTVVPTGNIASTDVQSALAELDSEKQPLDSDLTAIAALTTTTFGRALLALADAAAGRSILGLGTAALSASTDFQPLDSDLTAIAALTTTSYGRSLLTLADAAAGRTLLGLGSLATKSAAAVPTDLTATGTPSSTTYLRGDGAWATPAGGGGVAQPASPLPGLYGLQGWTLDPALAFGANAGQAIGGGSGIIYLMGIYVPQAMTITSLLAYVSNAGASLTSGLLGIYNASGTRLGVTADQSSAWTTTGVKTMALTSSATVPAGINYVARLHIGTTAPQMYGTNNGASAFTNIGMAVDVFRGGFLAGQTQLPTTITLSSFGQTAGLTFVGLV